MVDGRVIASLNEDWTPAGSPSKHFESGSLVSLDLAQLMADPAHPKPSLIYLPGPREALQGVSSSKNVLLVSTLDNVRGRTLLFAPGRERHMDARRWRCRIIRPCSWQAPTAPTIRR